MTGRKAQGAQSGVHGNRKRVQDAALERVVHPLEPIYNAHSQVLVLGTMPSPVSRAVHFYYGHPQNRFWRVLAALFGEPVPHTNEERTAFVLAHRIALWDVLASCDIKRASDSSIKNPVPNDLAPLIEQTDVSTVFTTGGRASRLYERFDAPSLPYLAHLPLPSTSAANARMSFEELVSAYQPLLNALK